VTSQGSIIEEFLIVMQLTISISKMENIFSKIVIDWVSFLFIQDCSIIHERFI